MRAFKLVSFSRSTVFSAQRTRKAVIIIVNFSDPIELVLFNRLACRREVASHVIEFTLLGHLALAHLAEWVRLFGCLLGAVAVWVREGHFGGL